MDKHSPTPWRMEKSPNNSNFWVVRCDTGVSLATAWREADAAYIVEAVNGRAALRDLVRQSVETLEQVLKHADMTVSLRETVVEAQREARKALGEDKEELSYVSLFSGIEAFTKERNRNA